ncbi:unnamed protein product [Orchesella dallaii]|uniref:Uncharacterized protein n=1 Tax=Orchesella dallaii TaxID=48710 RepID=A0ABP1PPG2_9HEXA
MWLSRNFKCHNFVPLILWILTFAQLLEHSSGFFFPFMNLFEKFQSPNNNNFGTSDIIRTSSSSASGNVTSFRIPMLPSQPHRRIDVVTTVVTNPIVQPKVENNVSTSDPETVINSKLVVPTSTSITTSISSSSSNHHDTIVAAPSLTLPFTPNLFGMMSYVQALKDIKRNYKVQELERKIIFHNQDPGGDLTTRVLRTLIHKVVNKYQKQTELLKLKILKRQEKLLKFLQLPMVAQVIASDQPELLSASGNLGKDGGATTKENSEKPAGKSFLDSFLIRK